MQSSNLYIIERLAELLKENARVVLATVVSAKGSTPREVGARMLVFPDGRTEGTVGGGLFEKRVTEDALSALSEGASAKLVHYALLEEQSGGIGVSCGGACDVFIEVFSGRRKVLVVGGGHVGQAVARIAQASGFSVGVVEDRPEQMGAAAATGARVIAVKPNDEAILKEVDEATAVVIVTRTHAFDLEALRLLLRSPAFYIGMIGSKRKVGVAKATLREEGVPSVLLEKIYAPIGLDIGAETPEEIAVSIVAEIISVMKRKKPSAISLKVVP